MNFVIPSLSILFDIFLNVIEDCIGELQKSFARTRKRPPSSGGTSIFFCLFVCLFVAVDFSGEWRQDIFQMGQTPQKVISFDHFVQGNDRFFLVSLKSGGKTFWGANAPLALP